MKRLALAIALLTTPASAQEVMLECDNTWGIYWNKYNNYISVRGTNQVTREITDFTIDAYDLRLWHYTDTTDEEWEIDRSTQRGSYARVVNGRLEDSYSFSCNRIQ